MEVIDLNYEFMALMSIKQRIKVIKGWDAYDFLDNKYAKISYCINPISSPMKIAKTITICSEMSDNFIKKWFASEIYDSLHNAKEQKITEHIAEDAVISKTIKIKDINLIGLED